MRSGRRRTVPDLWEVLLMEIRVLKYFLAVARHENISRAADELNLTQPTLSRQIGDLEEELGSALLVRGKRKTILTEAGLFLKARAEEIVALERKTAEEFAHAERMVAGDVYIGCGETEAMRGLVCAMTSLHKSHPNIHVHLVSGNEEQSIDQLQKGLVDFSLLCRSTPPLEYIYRKLPHEDVWGLYLHRDSPLAAQESIDAKDLLGEPLIVSRQAMQSKEFDNWLGRSAEGLNVVATYNLVYNAVFLVEQGWGSVLSFAGLIPLGSAQRQNVVFRPLAPKLKSGNYLVCKKGQVFSRAGRLVLSCLDAAFAREAV